MLRSVQHWAGETEATGMFYHGASIIKSWFDVGDPSAGRLL
jgi:hypothetical protein